MNYLLRYTQLLSIAFIIISNSALSSNGKSATTLPSGWEFVPTSSSHVIAITTDVAYNCIDLSVGDYIGVFYTNDQGGLSCGGAVEWQSGQNFVVVAYGDDITTIDIKDGFSENEVITWKVFYSQSATEQLIYVDYDSSMPNFNGLFCTNGISMLVSVLNPMEIMANAVPNEVCFGDEVQLSVNISGGCGNVEYSWSSDPVGFVSSQPNPLVAPLDNTTYFVTVSNSFGDTKTDEVTVTVKSLPQIFCSEDFEVCLGSESLLLNVVYPQGGVYSGDGVVFENGAYYFEPWNGIGDFLVSYCYTDNSTGCSDCCEFIISVKADQLIEIPTGWSGISSNITPENSSLPELLYPITYPLIILYNFDGIYWPGGNTFTIVNWNVSSGYVIKSEWDTTLPICGITIQNSIVQLNEGWNMIPVYSFNNIDVELLFSNVEGFEIATDVAGLGVYWPEYGINTLGAVKSGKAYLVKTNSSGAISFSR